MWLFRGQKLPVVYTVYALLALVLLAAPTMGSSQPRASCTSSLTSVSVVEPSCYARGIHGQPGVCGAYSLAAQERGSIVSISAGCGMTARTYELGVLTVTLPRADSLLLRQGTSSPRAFAGHAVNGTALDAAALGGALEVVCGSEEEDGDPVVFRMEGSDRAALVSSSSSPSSATSPFAAAAAAAAASPSSARACGSSLCCLGTPEWGDGGLFLLPTLPPHSSSPLATHLRSAGLLPPRPAATGEGVSLTLALITAVSSPYHRIRYLSPSALLDQQQQQQGQGAGRAGPKCFVRAVPASQQKLHPPALLLASGRTRSRGRGKGKGKGRDMGVREWALPASISCSPSSSPSSSSSSTAESASTPTPSRSPSLPPLPLLPERTLVYAVPSPQSLARGARAAAEQRAAAAAAARPAPAPVTAAGARARPRSATGLALSGDADPDGHDAATAAAASAASTAATAAAAPAPASAPVQSAGSESIAGAGSRRGLDDMPYGSPEGSVDTDDDGEAYVPPPVPGAVTFLQLRTFHKFVGMAVNAVLKPMVETVQDQTGLSDGQAMQSRVKATVTERTPPQVIFLAREPFRRNVTNMVVDATALSLEMVLSTSIPIVLAPHISTTMNEEVTQAVTNALAPLLERTITYDVSVKVPAVLRRSLPLALSHTLTRGIAHAVVPAVAAALSHSTTATEHCRSCFYEKKGCWLCGASEHSTYYRNYHATHFADYYSDYYAPYYYAALNKVVNQDVPSVVPLGAGVMDTTGTGEETVPMAPMSVPDPPK